MYLSSGPARARAHPFKLAMLATAVVALMAGVSNARADGEPPAPRVKGGKAATEQPASRPRAARKARGSGRVIVVQPVVMGRQFPTPRFNDMMTTVLYRDQATANLLLDMGRWVDKPDSNGLTPLMVAVRFRDPDMTQLLLTRGADPNVQAPGGQSAMRLARRNDDGAMVAMLQRSGARQ